MTRAHGIRLLSTCLPARRMKYISQMQYNPTLDLFTQHARPQDSPCMHAYTYILYVHALRAGDEHNT